MQCLLHFETQHFDYFEHHVWRREEDCHAGYLIYRGAQQAQTSISGFTILIVALFCWFWDIDICGENHCTGYLVYHGPQQAWTSVSGNSVFNRSLFSLILRYSSRKATAQDTLYTVGLSRCRHRFRVFQFDRSLILLIPRYLRRITTAQGIWRVQRVWQAHKHAPKENCFCSCPLRVSFWDR